MPKPKPYKFSRRMRQITGMGGSYEADCRAAVVAALMYLDSHPRANPKSQRVLTAMLAGGRDLTECSYGGAVQTVIWIRKHGWEAYQRQMVGEDA
jgi:hypothetical protein